MTLTVAAGRAGRPDDFGLGLGGRPSSAAWDLLLLQTVGLTLQLVAVSMAWSGRGGPANGVSCAGIAVTFTGALWALTRPQLERTVRNTAVVCLGLTTTVQWRMNDPLLFKGYDEQLHMRTLSDIEASHSLFQPQPLLAVSPRYPGLEAVAAFVHQFGLPLMFAATAVVLLARLALVLTLCAAVEHLTGSPRAGGLAVAVYAISPQFVFFNSQFSYQTLSLPLALAAVTFIARARYSDHAKALFGGAAVCLVAMNLTHHLTSLLTAAFLAVWAVTESTPQARRRVFFGAVVAVLATTIWAAIQWSLLRDYFGPMIQDVASQLTHRAQRSPFTETGADPKAPWERMLLVFYAVAVTLTVVWLMVLSRRSLLRRIRIVFTRRPADDRPGTEQGWQPPTLLVVLAASIPLLFAARVLPRWGEVGDRASTFLYLPFSLLVVSAALYLYRRRRPAGGWSARRGAVIRFLVLALGTAAFLGGYLLGTGSAWARLPGGYLPGAEGRSMDAETLAAVEWTGEHLRAGSRIGADRLSSTLLASQARMWPVFTHDDTPEVAWLYQADEWGDQESDIARRKELRYLFVDRRFADQKPLVGTYFDESPPLQLSRGDLAKFDHVPGIKEIYRHGPISVYDLGGLGVPAVRSGWTERLAPTSVPTQAGLGFLLGIAVTLLSRCNPGRRAFGFVRSAYTAAGPLLVVPLALAVVCVASVLMILSGIWLGPWIFVALLVTTALANPRSSLRLTRSLVARFRWSWFAAVASLVAAVGAAIAISADHASSAHTLAGAPGCTHSSILDPSHKGQC